MSMLTGGGGTLRMIRTKGKLPKENIPQCFAWVHGQQPCNCRPEIGVPENRRFLGQKGRSAAVIIKIIFVIIGARYSCVLFLYDNKSFYVFARRSFS